MSVQHSNGGKAGHMIEHSSSLKTITSNLRARALDAGSASLCCLAIGASALLGCGDAGSEQLLGQAEHPILRGALDEEDHPEVLLLANLAGFLCTGTVISAEAGTGFLVTAAHCVTEENPRGPGVVPLGPEQFVVVSGSDFAASTTIFPAEAISVEPSYDGSFPGDDIAVVRFFFGDEPAPAVIEPLRADEDTLSVEDELLLIGFGQTEAGGENTARRRVARDIAALDPELVAYSQEDGRGACFGDSGGPGLAEVGGRERLAAVISGGVDDDEDGEDCAGGFGISTRVSGYQAFIEGVLAGDGG